jgi:ABC-type Fe3+-siderophore transport system, permease component
MSGRRSASRDLLLGSVLLFAVLVVCTLGAASVGAVPIAWSRVLSGDSLATTILLKVRLPRVVLAGLVGSILACSGLTFQTLLRNPLADPFILGVSGGAACAAAVATSVGLARYPGLIPLLAFGGAVLATFAVFALARRQRAVDSARLLLSGLVLNSFFSAVILLALSITRGGDLSAALRWMMGSISGATWSDAALLAVVLAAAMLVLAYIANDLRLLAFGEEEARALGIDTERVKRIAFLAASIATGAAVAVSGIIGFVGLLVPHAVRLIWRRDYRVLLPLSALAGAILLIAADALSRIAVSPAELPIGALTALLGVPFFLLLLRKAS